MADGIYKFRPGNSTKQLALNKFDFWNKDERAALQEAVVSSLERSVRECVTTIAKSSNIELGAVQDYPAEKRPLALIIVSSYEGELSRHDIAPLIDRAIAACKQDGTGAEALAAIAERFAYYAPVLKNTAELGKKVRAEIEEAKP